MFKQSMVRSISTPNFMLLPQMQTLAENWVPTTLLESREPRGVEEAGCKIYSGAPTVNQTTG